MIKKILSGSSYAVTSSVRGAGVQQATVTATQLVDAFGRAAVREGFAVNSETIWGGAGVATLRVGSDVPFDTMQSVMQSVAQAFNIRVFLSPAVDVAGKRVMDAPMDKAADIVRQNSIISI